MKDRRAYSVELERGMQMAPFEQFDLRRGAAVRGKFLGRQLASQEKVGAREGRAAPDQCLIALSPGRRQVQGPAENHLPLSQVFATPDGGVCEAVWSCAVC